MDNKKNEILNEIKNFQNWMQDIREDFHMYPELGTMEFRTSEKIREVLESLGIYSIRKSFVTGVIADIEGIDSSITIALRGDIDALPMDDLKNKSYSSKNSGVCHACGHDVHTTVLLGVAKYFSTHTPPCNIRLLFQPAEETVGGARPMIDEGALTGVNCIFGLHVDDTLEVGKIGYKFGVMNASSDTLNISVKGKSCHGAYPSGGVDAIVIAANLILSLQTIVSRNIDARESGVISIGTIQGGTQGNIVADRVQFKGTLRTLNPETRNSMLSKISEMVTTLPRAFGGEGIFTREEGYTSLINHDWAVEIIRDNSVDLLGENSIYQKKIPNMGVEDFAYFLEKVPGAFFTLGVLKESQGIVSSVHNGNFDIHYDALSIGVAMQILNVDSSYSYLTKKK